MDGFNTFSNSTIMQQGLHLNLHPSLNILQTMPGLESDSEDGMETLRDYHYNALGDDSDGDE